MKDKQVERLEREIAELEKLKTKKDLGELTSADQARLDSLAAGAKLQAWGFAFLGLVLVAGLIWWFAGMEDRQAAREAEHQAAEQREEERRNSPAAQRRQAAYACSEFVRQQLKAPTTAGFPQELRRVSGPDNGEFTVTGVVDAENSFGAMLRQPYSCRTALVDGDWYRLTVEIGD